MARFPAEQDALDQVVRLAEMWGYGNIIHYLEQRWATKLIRNHGVSPETAAAAAFMNETHQKEFVEAWKG